MKKRMSFLLALVLILGLTACGSKPAESKAPESEVPETEPAESAPAETNPAVVEDEIELIVFAAASMTETLQEIEILYKETAPNVKLTFNFDSSGTLKTQIQEGADCDLFISAGKKQVDELDISADSAVNTDGLDFIMQDTRVDLLENKVTLCIPEGNPAGITDFASLVEKFEDPDILFAMGNSDVPVGQYTQKILAYLELSEEELAAAGKITYGSNVKEVTTQISEGSVSCGVVYCTDAFSAGLEIADYATADMCGRVIYPAALIKGTANADAAKAFLSYLQSEEAMKVFENVGFSAA